MGESPEEQHLYPIVSNIRQLLDKGFAESLDSALGDGTPQRAHLLQSRSNRTESGTLDQLPGWLRRAHWGLQRITTPELRRRRVRYLRGFLVDTTPAPTKRTHPRALRLCTTDALTTAFWVNLVVACDGPAADASPASVVRTPKSANRLPNALNDLSALSEFYRPMRIGDPGIALPASVGRSEGFFERTVVLANPSSEEVKRAFDVLMHWVRINSEDPEFRDPEFRFFQVNVIYSGHAYYGDSLGHSSMFLGKTKLPTQSLVEWLLDSTVHHDVTAPRATVNLFLDSCYSAAVARDFVVYLQEMQDKAWRASRRPLYACSKLYCSSLEDEESFDEVGLGHSCFVAAYLRENSRARVSKNWPWLHDIGLRTAFAQNPVMISLEDGGMRVRFPSLQLLKDEFKSEYGSEELQVEALQRLIEVHDLRPSADGYIDVHPIDWELAKLKLMRETIKRPDTRVAASAMLAPSYEERVHYWLF